METYIRAAPSTVTVISAIIALTTGVSRAIAAAAFSEAGLVAMELIVGGSTLDCVCSTR